MKKINFILILFWVIIFSLPSGAWAKEAYREVATSKGKVIVGLDRENAYQRFGAPASKGDGLWYYTSPSEFFVSFSATPSLLLFPDSAEGSVDVPMEFKAFLSLPDMEIRDITKEVQLVFDQPSSARIIGQGVIMPRKAGKYSALAMYQELLSNPINLEFKDAQEGDQKTKETLLSIDILPYRPVTTPGASIDFVALGTFLDNDLHKYSVRDISNKAAWLMRLPPNASWSPEEGKQIFFLERARQVEILANYQGVESFIQYVQVKEQPDQGQTRLKHLVVLPEVMVVLPNNNIMIKAFGTHYNNGVTDLTQQVKWKINNPAILEVDKNGYFFTRSEGVTEVVAVKDGLESLPVKVVVANNQGRLGASSSSAVSPGLPGYNMLGEIEDNVDKLKKDFLVEKKELKSILISPKLLEISLGEDGRLSATGIYDDGSSSDLTVLGEWGTLNAGIATVSGGNVASVAVGQTSVFVEFKGVRSEYINVVVGGPRLISLTLTPESLNISRDAKAKLQVQGNYYDKSQRDLTELVTWGTEGASSIKIEKGVVWPLKFGRSVVFAEYSLLKSNTANINVVLTLGWLLWLIAKIILALFLLFLGVLLVLYLSADDKRRRLRLLRDNPRQLILELHENATRLVTVFGLRYDNYTFPLFYAEAAKKKFLLENNVFLNFSVKYEEAKYSKHDLKARDLAGVVNDYNHFFESLCKDQKRTVSFYRYFLALLYRRPIFVLLASEINTTQ